MMTSKQMALGLAETAADPHAERMAREMEMKAYRSSTLAASALSAVNMTAATAANSYIYPGGALGGHTPVIENPKQPVAEDGLTPTDFVIWLTGVVDVQSAEPPTPEQWARVRAKLTGQVAGVARHRLGGLYKPFTTT